MNSDEAARAALADVAEPPPREPEPQAEVEPETPNSVLASQMAGPGKPMKPAYVAMVKTQTGESSEGDEASNEDTAEREDAP